MRPSVALVGFAAGFILCSAVLAQNPAEPGPEVLREQIQYRPFTIRIFGPKNLYWQSRIQFSKGEQVVYEQSVEEFVEVLKNCPTVCDLDGDKQEELVLQTFSGGAHCCFSYLVFSLGDTPALMARLEARDSGAMIKDADGDGIAEFHAADMAFDYFGASHASSVHPPIVLLYQNGSFHLAAHLMRKPAPAEAEWQKRVDSVRADWDNKEVMGMTFEDEEWGKAPPSLWGNMLDLIYSGNGELAWKFLDELWPDGKPGKDAFRKDFEAQLGKSDYYDDVLKLNGWEKTKQE